MVAASASSSFEIATDGPVLNLINKRLRALRKKLNRIMQMEALAKGGYYEQGTRGNLPLEGVRDWRHRWAGEASRSPLFRCQCMILWFLQSLGLCQWKDRLWNSTKSIRWEHTFWWLSSLELYARNGHDLQHTLQKPYQNYGGGRGGDRLAIQHTITVLEGEVEVVWVAQLQPPCFWTWWPSPCCILTLCLSISFWWYFGIICVLIMDCLVVSWKLLQPCSLYFSECRSMVSTRNGICELQYLWLLFFP